MTLAILTAVFVSQTYFTPEEAQSVFQQANDAFYKDPPDYAAAKAGYLKLIEHGDTGADVLFNLGTACLASGELGEAVLYLERARRLARSDDIEANLAVAHQRQGDQVVGGGAAASEPFLERVSDANDERISSWLSLVFIWLSFGLAFLVRRLPVGSRWLVGLALAASIATAVLFTALTAVDAWASSAFVEAVVMPTTARVREFPGDNAHVAFEVHAGLKVRIMEESGKFVRIRLPNNLEGWTEREGVAAL
jgi:tetratricopeptide (TPR) repeat protein